ncbi:MAG: hypothetical protein BWK80_55270 [Desulfobacteraceae bacterium IS3]|nr:MAG: hypothetical protein BWK80_55270 [Desulfobacteraceae bacterium IS3]HAO20926.1 hypothetical protein [Desulfobacteraceae bacterium]
MGYFIDSESLISSDEAGMNQTDDDTQFAFAVMQARAIVTNNFKDFAELHDQYEKEAKSHYGIIFIIKCSVAIMIRRLRKLPETLSQEQIINQIRWLNEFE